MIQRSIIETISREINYCPTVFSFRRRYKKRIIRSCKTKKKKKRKKKKKKEKFRIHAAAHRIEYES